RTYHSNCHANLVDGGSEVALTDAGAGVWTGGIVKRIERTGLAPERVRKLFVTHSHADHAGGAGKLRASFSLDVHASSDVARILRAGDETAASVDVGKAQGTYDPDYRYEATPVARELRDGDRVQVGEVVVEAIATPGHSVGHMCYLVHDGARADLFTGDTLFFGGRIALQNTWDCDLRSHLDSLRRLADHPFDGLRPAH